MVELRNRMREFAELVDGPVRGDVVADLLIPPRHPDISESAEHGVALRLADAELADQFDDYLIEQCYVLFNVVFDEQATIFHFGQASEQSRVLALFEQFARQN